jgi:hypothetical protein
MKRRIGIFLFLAQVACMFLGMGGVLAGVTQLPEKMKDIPLLPESKIQQTMDMDVHCMATVEVKAKPEAILDFYKKNLGEKGWKIIMQVNQGDDSVIQFQKGTQMLNLSVKSEEQKESITYTLVLITQQ